MNPPGIFTDGQRQRQYSDGLHILPLSARLIPEFSGRRNIRDMLTRTASLPQLKDNVDECGQVAGDEVSAPKSQLSVGGQPCASLPQAKDNKSPLPSHKKRTQAGTAAGISAKRHKSTSTSAAPKEASKGQQSLQSFLKPTLKESPSFMASDSEDPTKIAVKEEVGMSARKVVSKRKSVTRFTHLIAPEAIAKQDLTEEEQRPKVPADAEVHTKTLDALAARPGDPAEIVHDPIESRESWSKLFAKPIAPRCEGHDEPCINLLTKKPGINLGRSFWICSRPLGPSGAKEKNTQWRCQTFIWCSDWNAREQTCGI